MESLYYTVYALLLASLIFELTRAKTKDFVLIAWAVFFTLWGGLRWQTGGDWDQYHDHFLFSKWSNIFNYDRFGNGADRLEPGFVFCNVLIKSIFGTFYWYNILLCGFIQYTYVYISKYYCPKHPVAMYVFLGLMANMAFPVRQGFSTAVIFWTYKMIKERRLKAYLLLVFFAFEIHHASLIFLPAYWIGKFKLKNTYIVITFVGLMAIGTIFQDLFTSFSMLIGGEVGQKFINYTEFQTDNYLVERSYLIGNIISLILLFAYLKTRQFMDEDEYWINTLINCFVLYYGISFIFRDGMGDLTRLKGYYFLSNAILFMYTMFKLEIFGKIYHLAGISFFVLYMGYQVTKTCDGYFFKAANIPYKTIFDYQNTI